MSKVIWSLQTTDNYFVVTRQVQTGEGEDGTPQFSTKLICRETLDLAGKEILVSVENFLKQAQKDAQKPRKA